MMGWMTNKIDLDIDFLSKLKETKKWYIMVSKRPFVISINFYNILGLSV